VQSGVCVSSRRNIELSAVVTDQLLYTGISRILLSASCWCVLLSMYATCCYLTTCRQMT
jgi:hypothetical protein